MKFDNMNADEKTKYFATGRCTVGKISQFMDKCFIDFWVPRVRGMFVRVKGCELRYNSPEDAMEAAIRFREIMREKVRKLKED